MNNICTVTTVLLILTAELVCSYICETETYIFPITDTESVIGTDLSTVDTLSNTTLTGKRFYEEQRSCKIDLNLYCCSYAFFSCYRILLSVIDFLKNVFF